jgi:hypothetical protein
MCEVLIWFYAPLSLSLSLSCKAVDYRLDLTQGLAKCDPALELAILYFFSNFRIAYIGEHHGKCNRTFLPV